MTKNLISPLPLNRVNLKLVIEYDGAGYSGWQKQKDKKTIQGETEKAIKILFPREKTVLTGAGRTDAGVSAFGQCANFRISRSAYLRYTNDKLLYRLNALLPSDIAIMSIKTVPDEFHARYSAVSRTYKYFFSYVKRGVISGKYFLIKKEFNFSKAQQLLKMIQGSHSFKSFCRNKYDKHGFFCNVLSSSLRKLPHGIIEFKITANRFLHSMVRALAGVLYEIGCMDADFEYVKIKFKKGENPGFRYLPPDALFLYKVNY